MPVWHVSIAWQTNMGPLPIEQMRAKRKRDAREPDVLDGSPDAQIENAKERGRRETLRECADTLRMLVDVLGSPDSTTEV